MLKSAVAALALAETVDAFAPAAIKSSVVSRAAAPAMSYENELGVIPPTGYFDPLGLATNIDAETFATYRTAELKHGRVAMLCVIGYIVPEIFRWPGDVTPGLAFADIPNGVAAINAIPSFGWLQIVFAVGAVDYWGFLGDFPNGKAPKLSAEKLEERKLQELQHGRLAMLASLELLRHDSQNFISPGFDGMDKLITGLPFLYE